jgi:transcription elongation GreA/GreB family factor
MDVELQAMVEAGKISAKAAETLDQLKPETFCIHKSWGFGRVSRWNLLLNQIVIDFETKKHHTMQVQYAAETLQPLPEDHFLVRKAKEPQVLQQLAKEDPVELSQIVLESFGGKITQDQLQKALAPDVVAQEEFKKWWDSAKKALRKDGRFSLPAKKTDNLTIRDKSISYSEELLESFRNARQLKSQLGALEQILKNAESFEGKESDLQQLIVQVEEIANQNQRLHAPQAIELLVLRDELCARLPELKAAPLSVAQLLKESENRLSNTLSSVSTSRQRSAINEFPRAFPQDWSTRLLSLLQSANARLVGEIAKTLIDNGHSEALRQNLHRAITEHSISSEILYWLCKERGAGLDLFEPELMAAVFGALERDQFNENRRGSKLHDLLIDDRELVPDLIVNAPSAQARDLMRRMLLTPAFEELNKRSLMARMIKVHPELQSMVSGEVESREESLVVSWSSLQRRKEEYDDLVTKKIPENSREISVARSYGDLRENFEYKAAKEMQTVLMRRKAELEHMLSRARGSSFEDADTSQVSIGTVVTLRDTVSGESLHYTILGAWDSVPEEHVLSYQTAIGQALLAKKPGETAELPTETGVRHVEIVSIEAYQTRTDESLSTVA